MKIFSNKKMKNVTRAHFYSTVLIGLVTFSFFRGAYSFSGNASAYYHFEQYIVWHEAWGKLWQAAFYLLQPQFLLMPELEKIGLVKPVSSIFTGWLIIVLSLLSMPLWSISFGWFIVKLDNWLNHFPVLGKKVF